MLLDNTALGWLSTSCAIVSMAPYFHGMYRGTTKPHLFSWLIWSVVTAISFGAEYSDNGGPGAWSTGAACITCSSVTVIAFFKGEHHISRGDITSLICASLALPLWYFTHDPLGSVIIVTAIDVIGFYPTIRKSYNKPYEESMFTYFVSGLNFFIALFAIEHWSMVTWLYPFCTAFTCWAMVTLLGLRRRAIRNTALLHSMLIQRSL